MNKICIVARNKETYFIKRLIEEVGHIPVFDPWSDFELPESLLYLPRTTGVYNSDLDLMILQGLSKSEMINPVGALKKFRTKNHQYTWFEEENIPVPGWIPIKGSDLLTIEKFFRLYPEGVVKPLAGQGGWGVEILKWENFKAWKKKQKGDEDFLLQALIKGGQEYRYFFIEGEDPIILLRSSPSGVAANFKQEGEAKISDLEANFKKTLFEVAQKSGLFYGAIDLIIKDGHLWVLEVNAVPGIEQLEKVSGINIIQRFLQSLKASGKLN